MKETKFAWISFICGSILIVLFILSKLFKYFLSINFWALFYFSFIPIIFGVLGRKHKLAKIGLIIGISILVISSLAFLISF